MRRQRATRRGALAIPVLVSALAAIAVACGGDGAGGTAAEELPLGDVRAAVEAVERELGSGQEYFEVTVNKQLTNVFVAVEGATAALPYVYLDGVLQAPAPVLDGAAGQTFTAAALDFDPDRVLAGVRRELPESSIDAFSVEGGPEGRARYVVSVRSAQGGLLDVVVGADGTVFEVNPL